MSVLQPKRQLGLLPTFAIVVGVVIGSGIFINLPIVAKIAGSPVIATLIWLLSGIIWIPQILVLAEMGTAYPNQGGPYYYLYKAGSPFLAFVYTWTAFLTSDTPTLTIVGLAAADALTYFVPGFEDPFHARQFASVLIIIFAAIQYRSVKTGSAVQIVLTVSKLAPLFAIVFIGFFYFGSGNLFVSPVDESGAGISINFDLIIAGIASTIWAYAGFLNILYMAGEVSNPKKTLPRALIGSLFFVMAAYVLISISTSAIVPFGDLIGAAGGIVNPFAYLGVFEDAAGGVFSIIVFVSMLGVLNSCAMTQPRLEYAMAKDGLFFDVFGKLHPEFLTPHISIVIQSGLAIYLLLLGNLETLLGYFTISYLVQNALVYGAIFGLRKRPDYKPTYRAPMAPTLAVIAILTQIVIAYGTFGAFPVEGVIVSLVFIVAGVPLYLFFKKQQKLQD